MQGFKRFLKYLGFWIAVLVILKALYLIIENSENDWLILSAFIIIYTVPFIILVKFFPFIFRIYFYLSPLIIFLALLIFALETKERWAIVFTVIMFPTTFFSYYHLRHVLLDISNLFDDN